MPVVVRPLVPQSNEAALALWEGSVRATHLFVREEHVLQYKELVRGALAQRPLDFYGLYEESDSTAEEPLRAFMAVEPAEAMLGMLFVAAAYLGCGYGTRLLQYALELGVHKVDVNEQNVEACGFYESKGFVAQGRAPLDGVGNPYPLIHLALPDREQDR